MSNQGNQTVIIEQANTQTWQGARPVPLLITLLVGFSFWFMPVPEGLTREAWHLFSIFIAMITGLIVRPLPTAPVVLIGALIGLLTQSISMDAVMKGYGQSAIWLIVFSFFLARALIKSGLATRMAYFMMSIFGKSTLGTSYSVIFSELLISPFVPSLSARSGGIIFPIAYSLASHHAGNGEQKSNTSKFIFLSVLNGSVICSALFMTSMAGNPMAAEMAMELGIEMTWMGWATAALVPGLITLVFTPWIISKIIRPESMVIPGAREEAQAKLKSMGSINVQEWSMLTVFAIVLSLWIGGPSIGVDSTTSIMIGLGLLFLTGILSWKDCLKEESAWDTFIWLSILISFGIELKHIGFFTWVGSNILLLLGDISWQLGFLVISLMYFTTRYFFASSIAHITAMYFAFLVAAVEVGTPPLLAAYGLAFFGALPGGLTHYASNPSTIFFGAGFVTLKEWWTVGAIVGFSNLAIWIVVGGIWWKILGLY